MLREVLNDYVGEHTKIVAADGNFSGIAADILKDQTLKAAVGVLGSVLIQPRHLT